MANDIEQHLCSDDSEQYWQRTLPGELPVLDVCLDHIRPPMKTYVRERAGIRLSEAVSREFLKLCRESDRSVLVMLAAAVKALWLQHGADDALVIGSATVAHGAYVNPVPLVLDLSGNPSVTVSLERVARAVREARRHGDFPFGRTVSLRGDELASSRSPIFQTMVLAFDLADRWSPPRAAPQMDEIAEYTAGCDAVFLAGHDERGLLIDCEYDAALFRPDTINRRLAHLRTLIESMLAAPEECLLHLSLLDPDEATLVVRGWNQTGAPTPMERSAVELFQDSVAAHPDAIAAQFEDRQLTYGQLNRMANRVAGKLRAEGVGPEDLVALLDDRSLNLLVAMLGVWKSGAAYVPLDPRHPAKRIAAILETSRARVAIAGRARVRGLGLTRSPLIAEDLQLAVAADADPDVPTDPRCLAYAIFTSGSTGAPKGVMIEQRGMVNHLFAKIWELGLGPHDIVAQTASQCFDISVWQFIAPLLAGARVHIVEDAVAYDPTRLLGLVARHRITVLQTVPSFLHAVLGESRSVPAPLPHLRWLISTGEALSPELCRQWLQRYPRIPIINAYGPTECSDDVTHHVLAAGHVERSVVPIGRPLANTQIYVTDPRLGPRPVGMRGELVVGGAGVGRGYCASPDLTAEAYVPNPFSDEPGGRLYRTGDSSRWASEGHLEYLGRLDQQLKVRGFRIEPREIEVVLAQFPEVEDAVVTARDGGGGTAELVAYALSTRQPRVADLHEYSRARLPSYMLPAAYVVLARFPRTANGKIDRDALPAPTSDDRPTIERYEPPRGATERALAEKWAALFDLDLVGRHDNFLDLGGHSLLATQLVSWIYEAFRVKLSIRDIFEAPFIDRLVERIDALRAVAAEPRPGEEEVLL
jgi:amino acid adenylation domain-containing protein